MRFPIGWRSLLFWKPRKTFWDFLNSPRMAAILDDYCAAIIKAWKIEARRSDAIMEQWRSTVPPLPKDASPRPPFRVPL